MKFNKNKILIACLSLFMATQTQAANDTKEQKSIEGIYQVNFNKEINVLSTILIDKENLYVNADILSDPAFSKFNFDDNIRVLNDKKYIYIPLSLVKKIDDNEMTLSILLDDRFFDKKNSITKEFNYKNRYYRLIDNENIVNYFNNNYQLNSDNQEKLSAYLETNYANLKHFSYNIQANSGQNYSYNRAGIKGAMLYLPEDNQFLFNRMTNGVILVDTDQKENEDNSGLEVLHQNKMSGFTNNNGQYTIVNAIPYSKEKIELNLKALPLDKNFEVFKKEIIVPYYGAAKVKFNQILPDSIITVKNLPFGAIFKIKDDSFIVGKDGETSVNQVGLATFETDGLKCSFNVSVNQKEYE